MLWGLRPIQPLAAYGQAVDRIVRQVHLGLLLPGERLPPERKLAEEMTVSRVTLREALRILETSGYLEVRRGAQGGAFVVGRDDLRELAQRRVARDPAAIMRVLEFREAIQPAAARLAAARRGVPELKKLRAALERMRTAEEPGVFRQGETLFHLAVGEACHNAHLARGVEDAIAEMFRPLPTAMTEPARERDLAVHAAALAAIDARDETAAGAALAEIVARDWERLRNRAKVA